MTKSETVMKSRPNSWAKRHRIGKTRTISGVADVLLFSAKARAEKNGGICTLKKPWILAKLKAGHCELTKKTFKIECDGHRNLSSFAPSLDRIDNNNRDYTEDNTRLVLTQVNITRNNFSDDVIKHILERLVPALDAEASASNRLTESTPPEAEPVAEVTPFF